MKTIRKPILCCIILASTSMLYADNKNNNPFSQLFNHFNQMVQNQMYQNHVNSMDQQNQNNTNMPFFNDPFFNNNFGQSFNSFSDDNQDDSSFYVFISNDPNAQAPNQQQIRMIQNVQQPQPPTRIPLAQVPTAPMVPRIPMAPQVSTTPQVPTAPQRPTAQQPNTQRWIQRAPQGQSPSFGGMFPLMGGNMQDPRLGQGGQASYKQYNPEQQKQKVTFKDVLGQKEAIKEISEVVDFLKNPEEYHKLGAEIPKGIMLEGPPGTGKTLLARAVAGEAGCTFIHASGSQFINKYVGTGADNIRKLFEQARSQAPAIVFIDEIDAIGSRDQGDNNQEYHHTINELLGQLDGFQQEDNIIVMAATNFSKSLDKALLRPGRFDRIVKVGLPTRNGRNDILKYYIKKKKLSSNINVEELSKNFSQRTSGFSGAELKKLANEAALAARRDNAKTVSKNHFELAYDKIILGLANDLERSPEQLKRTAYHEAGHTLVKLLTDQPVAKVSILSRGDALGATFEKEKYETASEYQKEELAQRIMALQGGFVAEKVALNSTRPGASADLEQINHIANAMVKEFGMGNGELEGITYKGMVSDTMKDKFDKEVLSLMQNCKQKTETLLSKNQSLLDKLANELLSKETLDETDIYKAVGRPMPVDKKG